MMPRKGFACVYATVTRDDHARVVAVLNAEALTMHAWMRDLISDALQARGEPGLESCAGERRIGGARGGGSGKS
jgi:hypothetical protein